MDSKPVVVPEAEKMTANRIKLEVSSGSVLVSLALAAFVCQEQRAARLSVLQKVAVLDRRFVIPADCKGVSGPQTNTIQKLKLDVNC